MECTWQFDNQKYRLPVSEGTTIASLKAVFEVSFMITL